LKDITQRTFSFALSILKLFQSLNKQYSADRSVLGKQLLRSGTSVGANVEEAQSGQSRADFISKMSIALKEARETNYWLRLLEAGSVVRNDEISDLLRESEELKKILGAIIVSSKK
jgi:four helix bundle protein